jgi:hypothetical protein
MPLYLVQEVIQPRVMTGTEADEGRADRSVRILSQDLLYRVFQKELYHGMPNVTLWRVLRKRLHSKAYKLFIVQHLERWILCTPLSVFITLATH